MSPEITIWIDGGCRGNGTANAETYFSGLIRGRKDTRFCIDPAPFNTNNQAEYGALLHALEILFNALPMPGGKFDHLHTVEMRTDCQLILTHLASLKSRKDYRLRQLCEEVETYIGLLNDANVSVSIVKAPRDEIVAHLGH